MGELEDQLNSILSDPKQMEQIAGLARSLMGGGKGEGKAAPDFGGAWALIRPCCKGSCRR